MKIKIISKDKIKGGFAGEAIEEYTKRLARYCRTELKFTHNPEKAIKDRDYVIKVGKGGAVLSSEQLAERISSLGIGGNSDIAIVLHDDCKGLRIDFSLEISRMDIHEDLMLIMLYEQIYRAYRIINNEPYHK